MEAAVKIIGMSSEETCGCCGKTNLKRTVRVEVNGEEQHWGVICASKANGYSSKASDTDRLMKIARFAEQAKKILANGGSIAEVRSLPIGWPCRIKDGIFQVFNGSNVLECQFAV